MTKAPSLSMAQRLLLASQSMAPVAVKAALVQKLGPEQTAQLSPHMPPAQLRELILELPIDFLARVTTHLDPQLILQTYLALPDEVHLQVARQLCVIGAFATAARYAECLSAKQVKVLIYGINDADHVLQIARHIVDIDLIVQSLRSFSTGYLCRLTEAAAADDNVAISARVLSGLALPRQADVCAHLDPALLHELLPLLLEANDGLRELLPERLQAVPELL
ncbi:hypothetical protein SAMN05216601_10527 [Ectopseudomonas composti]|uniref:Uncharacterized protein n=1 Tax=Ectopseudomonas composti TaxID=658457 RepID=A0A1I5M8X6_9GAMM|nr:hypothetical protein [Pseudomonas composti]SFP06052.1 hypothetical protein SAMN05216601_10527 [Pseudomonas composti]